MLDVIFDKLKIIFSCNSSCVKETGNDTIEIKLNNKQILLLNETHANFKDIMNIVHSINEKRI